MCKCLITGGCGFIGSHIVEHLQNDFQISIVDNLITGSLLNVDNVEKYIYDITQYDMLQYVFSKEKPDYVIHLAAQPNLRYSNINPTYDAEVNIIGSVNVFRACKEFDVKKVIYTSTGGARYGSSDYPINEFDICNPISPYGYSKLVAEKYLDLFDLNYTVLCLGNVIGERDYSDVNHRILPILFDCILNEKPFEMFGNGESVRDYVDVKDLIRLFPMIFEQDGDLYNISSGCGTSINGLIGMVEKISDKKLIIDYKNALNIEVKSIILDNRKAALDLEWKPEIKLEKSIERIWNWYKKT